MKREDLLDHFIDVLSHKASSKKELAYLIADILTIEKESAYRRLGRQVQFTIPEMGILAKKLNISLDSLLAEQTDKTPICFKMNMNFTPVTIDLLINMLKEAVSSQEKMEGESLRAGIACHALPIEFYMFYPHLYKFMYFKWGRYYIGSREFDTFSSWEVPVQFTQLHDRLKKGFEKYEHLFYIWDNSLVWNLVNEINYHLSIHSLTPEDAAGIKAEIKDLLVHLEEFSQNSTISKPYHVPFELYVSYFNIGVSSYYIHSGDTYLSGMSGSFLQTVFHYDYETGHTINQWINSLKRISFLISGSGEKDRKRFFKQQHKIVDKI